MTGVDVSGWKDARVVPIESPDTATTAIRDALHDIGGPTMLVEPDDVFSVAAGDVRLKVRAHRALPLVLFRSALVVDVRGVDRARAETAALNRDSLWCRYVLDGTTIRAESELANRVFVPVNFKIQLTEVRAELSEVDTYLCDRVCGRRPGHVTP